MPATGGAMNEGFNSGEVWELPSIGLKTRAMAAPDELQPGQFLLDRG